jgi:hypothetical protein
MSTIPWTAEGLRSIQKIHSDPSTMSPTASAPTRIVIGPLAAPLRGPGRLAPGLPADPQSAALSACGNASWTR